MKKKSTLSYLLAGTLLINNAPAQASYLEEGIKLVISTASSLAIATGYLSSFSATALGVSCSYAKNAILNVYAHKTQNDLEKEDKQFWDDYYSEKDEEQKNKVPNLEKYLNNLAKTHHGLDNIKFGMTPIGPDDKNIIGHYHVDVRINKIYIPIDDYEFLLEAINQNNTDPIDQNRMNEILASIHHELGHIKNKTFNKVNSLEYATSAAYGYALFKAFPYMASMPIKTLAIFTGVGLSHVVGAIVKKIYCNYDEIQADDAIPNNPKLLRAAERTFRAQHDLNKKELEDIIADPASSLLVKTIAFYRIRYPELDRIIELDEHPSDFFRAERLKKRLEALKVDEQSQISITSVT